MPRFVALSLAIAGLFVSLMAGAASAAALDTTAAAPGNLGCQGRTLPDPKENYRWEWQWEVLDTYHFAGNPGGTSPYAVALDSACNLYVADVEGGQVVKISQEGESLTAIPTPSNDEPGVTGPGQGLAVDSQGNIYVSFYAHDLVTKYTPDGQVAAVWGVCDEPTPENAFCDHNQPGMFTGPRGIAVDGAGSVYVVELNRIQKLSPEGETLATWDMSDRLPTELWILGAPAIDAAENLYVPDELNNRVYKFSAEGALIQQYGVGPDPSPDTGQFHNPTAVAVDIAGNLFVAERYNWRVQKLAPDGSFLDQWRNCLDAPDCQFPDAGDQPGQFYNSTGLVVDAQGNLYVADGGNTRVERLMAHAVEIPEDERNPE